MTIDQIAYMSCAEQANVANEPNMYFTFRAGAYSDDAGLGLTDFFKNETRRYKEYEKVNKLASDPLSANTRVQFSLRKQNNLSQMFVNSSSGDGVEGTDYDYVFGTIGSDAMSAALLTMPTDQNYLNYWAAGGIHPDARFVGKMEYNASESLAQQVRTFMETDGIMTVGFADELEPTILRDPSMIIDPDTGEPVSTSSNTAYGSGFKISFKQPNPINWGTAGVPHFNMPKRVLASVTEYNLESPNHAKGSWSCPMGLQLRIADPGDVPPDDPGNAADCTRIPDPSPPTAESILIRRSLPESDWWINIPKRCVIPKKYTAGSCYGINAATGLTRVPTYDLTEICDPTINVGATLVCSHFVSICYKTL